jgi:hypothetical protein
MDARVVVKKNHRIEGGTIDKQEVTGKKNFATASDVHKGATEEKIVAVPAPSDPELFDDEPRQG